MAGKLTAGNFSYGAAQTRNLSVSAIQFVPELYDTQYSRFLGGTFALRLTGDSGLKYFQAPVNLPDGATVTRVRLRAMDNYLPDDATLILRKWSAGVGYLMARSDTSGAALGWQAVDDNTIDDPIIDNSAYNYFLEVGWDASALENILIGGAVITYTVPGPE